MTDHRQFTFTFKLLDHGWAESTVRDGDTILELETSYICDPLGDLARVVIDLHRSPGWERFCSWETEPGEFRWLLNAAGEGVNVKILWFRSCYPRLTNERGELVFESTASYRRIATQVCGQMKRVLNECGPIGYRKSWKRDFPERELKALIKEIEGLD